MNRRSPWGRSAWSFYTCLAASLAALPSCSGGGSSSSAPGAAPLVSDVRLPSDPAGAIPVDYTLADPNSSPVDVELQYSSDGGETWNAATVTHDSNVSGLATSPEGVEHRVTWDSVQDLGFRVPDAIRVRIQAKGSEREAARESDKQVKLSALTNLPFAADRVESYMIHFGAWDEKTVELAEQHDLVIVYPCEPTVTPELVREIQNGRNARKSSDDVIVLAYVNVGEDERTIGKSDAALRLDPRFVGDASGPRVDPRGPGPDGRPLAGLSVLGTASAGGGGYASFYLDDNSVEKDGHGDGLPDRNGVTGACYVNAGDPAWYEYLSKRRCEDPNEDAGIQELLSTKVGRGYGFDGLMLDNVDTCAPNSYTSASDLDHATFEWTAPGMAAFFARLRAEYPKHVIMQNRGLFFMNPGLEHYKFTTRAAIDFLKFESFRLDRQTSKAFDPRYFADNKFNLTPRLQAEANRRDGFQVLSLGYATGPGIDANTLVGASTLGKETLLEDIVEAHEYAGFRHYLTDNSGSLVNDFVRKHADFKDKTPPAWSSSYNANQNWPNPPSAPTPRVGIQRVSVSSKRRIDFWWDVALDLHPVKYYVYLSTSPIRFSKKGRVFGALRLELEPRVGAGYEDGVGPAVYPYENAVTNLRDKTTYYLCIRAVDSKGNEDDNRVVLSARTLE